MQDTKNIRHFRKMVLAILIAIIIIPLSTLAIVGNHSRYAADDFQNSGALNEFGLIGYMTVMYQNWTGRFSFIFTNSLFYLIGPSIVPFLTLISLILLSTIWYLVISSILQLFDFNNIHLFSFLLSMSLVLSTFSSMENIRQVLFWQSGLFNYVSPMILLPCFFLGIIKMLQCEFDDLEPPKEIYILVPTITFISGAFTEIYSVTQIILLACLIIYFLTNWHKHFIKKTYILLLISLVSALLSTLVVIVAPGNSFRKLDYPQSPSFPLLLKMVSQFSYIFISRQIKKKYIFMGIAFFSPLVGWLLTDYQKAKTHTSKLFKSRRTVNYVALFFVCLFVLVSTFIVPAWATSNYPEPRASSIATYMFTIFLLFIGTILGFEIRKKISAKVLVNYLIGSISVAFILFGSIRITVNQILIELPEAQKFSSQWDARDEILRTASENKVDCIEVNEIPNYYGLEQLQKLSPGYQWINSVMGRYYNISSMRWTPNFDKKWG